MPQVFIQPAFAKINLALGVAAPLPAGHPRAGFHEIASWMAPVRLRDEVLVEPCRSGERGFGVEWAADAPRPTPIDWPGERDLAFRAWRLLESETGVAMDCRVTVRKRVPVGGGLGGGSSDAAACLLLLAALFAPHVSRERLRALGATLGSDVPFFIDDGARDAPPRSAIVTGLGDGLERVRTEPAAVCLFIPPFGCPTGPVYRAFDALAGREATKGAEEARVRGLASAGGPLAGRALFNDLATAAEAVAPDLAGLRRRLAAAVGTAVHVTGSGSCCFAVVPEGAGASSGRAWTEAARAHGCGAVLTALATDAG
ncbi:MAG: hypothetical protein WCK33_05125 [Phycisphaerae bacterium]|jgi:4-diphosphocytidyl-2-C-methyl-D-erythritol kinase